MIRYAPPYLNSSAWIAWATGETRDGVAREPIVSGLIRAAERGDFRIYISAFTLAEVHEVPSRGRPKLDSEDASTLLSFFEHDYIVVIGVDRSVGEHAHRLCGQYAGLKPGDAIHLASALRAKCDVLLAWDRPLARITHPDIRIEPPQALS